MIKAVVFGGTTEGRRLCEVCSENQVPIVYCVATEDGARAVHTLPGVKVHIGRLDASNMAGLLVQYSPEQVYDATHPYAEEVSRNIAMACGQTNRLLLRIERARTEEQGYVTYSGIDDLIVWVSGEPGNVFVTTGASHAKAFTRLTDFEKRVWLRILPSIESLHTCLDFGYRPDRLICMQGPFSEELNRAMFKAANAQILITKNSGSTGGFNEKVRAAGSLGMRTVVLSKPGNTGGITLQEACKRVLELKI